MKLTVLLIFILLPAHLFAHPLHLSIMNIDFTGENQCKVSLKLFKDDFSLDLAHFYQNEKLLDSALNDQLSDSLITSYLNANFIILINHKKEEFQFILNKKYDDEAVYFEYLLNFENDPKNIEIENTMLISLYNDQKNLVFVNFKEQNEAAILNHKNKRTSFELIQDSKE